MVLAMSSMVVEGAGAPALESMATEKVAQLLDAIEEMRSTGEENEREVCGWRLQYSRRGAAMRANGGLDPRDGERLQSIVGTAIPA